MSDWKKAHANEASAFAEHRLIEDVLTEFAANMGFKREGLAEYGLKKIVVYVAQVVLARARGFDPEKLSMTPKEGNDAQRRLMEMFIEEGRSVIITIADGKVVASVDASDRASQP